MRLAFNETCLRGENDIFFVKDKDTGKDFEIEQSYPLDEWSSIADYSGAGVKGLDPMTAKELDTTEKQDEAFNNEDNYIEEKFDGTRGLLYFRIENGKPCCRIFSRRLSKKTGFYVENTDALPQLKYTDAEDLAGTIIDGELFIDGRPFKDVSSTLNCLWDKAIERQIELGFITFHAFDIISYRGCFIRNTPLWKRKKFLDIVVTEADNEFITCVPHYICGDVLRWNIPTKQGASYFAVVKRRCGVDNINFDHDTYKALAKAEKTNAMTPRAYYELIVATGGEGVIVKPKEGLYKHKRGWEYSKIKKFLTRELILIGFKQPTREYQGKAPSTWEYWEGDTPVTKHWYNKQVGNLNLGVLIHVDDYEKIPKNKRGAIHDPCLILNLTEKDGMIFHNCNEWHIMEVCECSGFDDETREYFTENADNLIGSVVEVRANEIMKDSGRMRHPRYERMRNDKGAEQCTWKEHII